MNSNRFLKYTLAFLSLTLAALVPGGGTLGITVGLVLVAATISELGNKLIQVVENLYEDEVAPPEAGAGPPATGSGGNG